MTEPGGGSHGPALTPVRPSGRGASAWVAIGLLTAAMAVLVGLSLVDQSGSRPDQEAAGATPTVTPTATPTAARRATPTPTPQPTPLAGTPPPRVEVAVGPAPTCRPGSTPDEPGSADQARPPAGPMAFDRESRRIVLVAEGGDGAQTWTFDVCANTWTRMHPDRQPPGGSVLGPMIYDVDSDLTIGIHGARVWAYDFEADTWTEKGSAPTGEVALRLYDPVSGLVVATGDDGDPRTVGLALWSYEVETDAWTPIRQTNRLPIEPREYAYDASVDRIVAYSNAEDSGVARTWLFDLRTGTWSGTSAVTPVYSYGWIGWGPPAVAYDETAERTVMAGPDRTVAYDATADRWETLHVAPWDQPGACGTLPECRTGTQMVYDAVNGRPVAYGGTVLTECTWEPADDMWAFDMATRSWTLVVSPTPVPPPLRDLTDRGATPSDGPGRSPWIHARKVTLHGGPFFADVAGMADESWPSTPPVAAASVADGLFLPECQLWTDGTVWWEETTSDPSSRAWIEIDLGGSFVLDAAVVQADMNDEYRLSYRDPATGEWAPLWNIPLGEAGGMATRPHQGDASVRWPLEPPVVTDALRFEATSGDALYSVSEVAVFGRPAP